MMFILSGGNGQRIFHFAFAQCKCYVRSKTDFTWKKAFALIFKEKLLQLGLRVVSNTFASF